MQIRPVRESDWAEWLRLTRALFPHGPDSEYEPEMRLVMSRSDAEVFVVERPDGKLAGYVEVGTRSVADGCDSSPVGYIEAWYVDPDVRRAGHGLALLAAAEAWAAAQGYSEMASDALINNDVSHRAHMAAGYEIVDRVVTFRKSLPRR